MKKITCILLFILLLSNTPAIFADEGKTPSGIPFSELKNQIDDYSSNHIGTSTAGAAVLIMKDGEIVLNTSYGYADVGNQVKITPETVFEWGSVTKLLVWTSAMQLVEQGQLDLEEDIRNYLPDGFLTKLQFDTPLTMMNLMHHDAGWEEKYTDLFYLSTEEVKPLKEMLQLGEPYQVNPPGEIVAYSNYGVALAGYIIEEITGQPFYNYVDEHIFDVLGMKNTTIHPTQGNHENLASQRDKIYGYRVNNGEFTISKNERVYIGLYPAGSAIGSIEDTAKFMMALMPQEGTYSRLFQKNNTLNDMLKTSDFYDNGLPRNSHGFWHGMYAVEVLEHGGNTESFSSNFTFSKEENLGVIVMTNQIGEFGLSYGIPNLIYGDYVSTNSDSVMPDAQEIEGSYNMARKPYKGFTKLYSLFMLGKVEAINDHSINNGGMTFEQIAPYLYRSTNEYNLHLHFMMNDGKVEKVSMATSDLLPVSKSLQVLNVLTLLAVIFSALYTLIAVICMLLKAIMNRKKAKSISSMQKWAMVLNILGIVPLINIITLVYRTFNYVPYASLKIHFWINLGYILIVGVALVGLLMQWKKTLKTRGQKVGYFLSCTSAILLVAFIIGWELYY